MLSALVAGPVGVAVGAIVGAVGGGLAGKAVAEDVDPTIEEDYWNIAAFGSKLDWADAPIATREAWDRLAPHARQARQPLSWRVAATLA